MPREDIKRDLTVAALNTIEFLQARDAELAEVQAMAVQAGLAQTAVAALTQRIRIALEIQALQASGELPIF